MEILKLQNFLISELEKSHKGQVFMDELPSDSTPYPFFYIGEMYGDTSTAKSGAIRGISQTVHIWSNELHKRGSLLKLLLEVERIAMDFEGKSGWVLGGLHHDIMQDDTTKTPLLHGVVEISYKF